MPVRGIQIGQVWKKNDTGESYLVTKLYTEALATYVGLRRIDAEAEQLLRVKVERAGDKQTVPGFTVAQETDDF